MQIEIEVYKGQTIFYDDENDKFLCEINMNDKYKGTKRSSLKDVRKEIDAFQKLNLEFKPFKAIVVSKWKDGFEVVNIVSIRIDGKLVSKKDVNDSFQNHLDEEDIARLRMYDPEILKELKEAKEIFKKAEREFDAKQVKIAEKLKPIDLSQYSEILNPNKNETE